MESFKLKKTSGDADVTHETLIWVAVLVVVVPLLIFVAGPYMRDFFAAMFAA